MIDAGRRPPAAVDFFLLDGATGISNLGSAKPYTSRDTGHNGAPIQISGGADLSQ